MSYKPGPYENYIVGPPGVERFKFAQSGTKQPQPIDRSKVLPYQRRYAEIEMLRRPPGYPPWTINSGYTVNMWEYPSRFSYNSFAYGEFAGALNKAYERFVDKMHTTAEMGITLATSRQALDMITSRAVQLRRGYSSLRRGRFREFAKTFGIKPLPKHRNTLRTRPRDASALWLEYWFGWTPLVADIYAATEVLQSPYPDEFVFATAKQKNQFSKKRQYWYERDLFCDYTFSVRIEGLVKVTNPNLYRANQLGLINPAVVVWDLIPFSFVVDWFIPVGNFLRSFSEFVGLRFEKSSHYIKSFWTGSETGSSQYGVPAVDLKASYSGYHHERRMGLPSYSFVPKPLKLPSATRAATAISLLVQLFIKP